MRDADGVTASPRVSVVIPTRNRLALLTECVDSLLLQNVPDSEYEVIIVAGGATEEVLNAGKEYARKNAHVRCEVLDHVNVSASRNKGWMAAQSDIVAFIDDDARVGKGWIGNVLAFFDRHPEALVVGGPYTGYTIQPAPDWFPENYGTGGPFGPEGPIDPGEWLNGTCMIFKVSLLKRLDGFAESLGPRGNRFCYAEDTNITKRIWDMGEVVYQSPTLLLEHAILPHKYSLKWLLGSSYKCGRDQVRALDRQDGKRRCVRVLLKAIWKGLVCFVTQNGPWKRRVVTCFNGAAFQAGVLHGMIERDCSRKRPCCGDEHTG